MVALVNKNGKGKRPMLWICHPEGGGTQGVRHLGQWGGYEMQESRQYEPWVRAAEFRPGGW